MAAVGIIGHHSWCKVLPNNALHLPPIVAFALLTDTESIGSSAYWEWLQLFAAFGLIIAYPTNVILGLPTYFFMLHSRNDSYTKFGVVGALISAAGVLIFFEPLRDANNLGFMVLIVTSGAAVATAFRGIAGVPYAPDNSRPHSAT